MSAETSDLILNVVKLILGFLSTSLAAWIVYRQSVDRQERAAIKTEIVQAKTEAAVSADLMSSQIAEIHETLKTK